jgi:hypothetical protein
MKRITGILLAVLSCLLIKAQNSYEITYSTGDHEVLLFGEMDLSGNTVFVGYKGTYAGKIWDAFIMKVYPDGTYIAKQFEEEGRQSTFGAIEVLDNGNYLAIGAYTYTGNYQSRENLWVVTLDADLEIVDEKSYLIHPDYLGFSSGWQKIVDNEGNIALAGVAYREVPPPYASPKTDFVMFKLNQSGDTLISHYHQRLLPARTYCLRKIPGSGNLMLLGRGYDPYGNNEFLFLDSNLNLLHYKKFSISGSEASNLSTDYWLNDNEFLIAMNSHKLPDNQTDFHFRVYKADTAAQFYDNIILNRPDTIEYMAWTKSMAYANDTTIYIAGAQAYNQFWVTTPTKYFLYLLDKNMNLLGLKFFGGDIHYQTHGVYATPDDGCIIYGSTYTNPYGIGEEDIYIRKVLREEIEIITRIEKVEHPGLPARVWPNPATDELYVSLDGIHWGNETRFQIFTITGYKVFDSRLSETGNLLRVSLSTLDAGVYAYRIVQDNGEVLSGKFMKIE